MKVKMKPLYALCLCLMGLLAIASAQTQRYEFKHSFRSPFYLGTPIPFDHQLCHISNMLQ